MADRTLTSANSVLTLTVPGIYPVPVRIQGYSTDRAWASDSQVFAETMMGVDGVLSGGYVPNPVRMTISLQADSLSRDVFNAIMRAMKTTREIIRLSATIDIPATGESYTCTRGVMVEGKVLPDGAKVLQATDYVIIWQTVHPTLL